MLRRLEDLRAEAEERNLDYSDCKSKADFEKLLASEAELEQIEVILARDYKDLSEDEQERILDDSKWVAEEKLDGVRMKAHVTKDGLRIDGRRKSVKTYIFTERTANFPHIAKCHLRGIPEGTVFDCELLMLSDKIDTGSVITAGTLTSTTAVTTCAPERSIEIQKKHGMAHLIIFDVVRWGGEYFNRPLRIRRRLLETLQDLNKEVMEEHNISITKQYGNKRKLYEKVMTAGGEGVMLKHLDGMYEDGKRSKMLLKWKKIYTTDAFITGWVPSKKDRGWDGLVGALEVSVIDNVTAKEVEIGAVQPGTLEFRKKISNPDGSLKEEYYNKVVEIRGNEWTKGIRLRHCVLVRWRPDKGAYDCLMDLDEVRAKWAR